MKKEIDWLLKEKYNGVQSDAFFSDCKRLAKGEPLAYVIGHIPFLDCTIFLDSHPLIPRPETEYWTEKFITTTKHGSSKKRILDLCAGSGCIGVAVARSSASFEVIFSELEIGHLQTIKSNLQKNVPTYKQEPSRYQIYQSDLFEKIQGKFDHILTNPPYIDPSLDRTNLSVRRYEPALALYGGEKGVHYLKQIIMTAPSFLVPGGTLWIEHEPEQVATIIELVNASEFAKCETHNDQYQTPRFTVCSMAL